MWNCTRCIAAVSFVLLLGCEAGSVGPSTPAFRLTEGSDEVLASALAEVLSSPEMKVLLRNDLRNSRWVEHKLPLREYLSGRTGKSGTRLATRLEQSTAWRNAGWADALTVTSQLPPLEIYMPVRASRRTWKPNEALVAAVNLVQESFLPANHKVRVFSGDNTWVEIDYWTDYSLPDAMIAIVPRETDFEGLSSLRRTATAPNSMAAGMMTECMPEVIECEGGETGGGGPQTWYHVTYWGGVSTTGDYDGVLQGDGEWSVWMYANFTSAFLCGFHNNIQEGTATFGPNIELMFSHGAMLIPPSGGVIEVDVWEEDGAGAPCTAGAQSAPYDTHIGSVVLYGDLPYNTHAIPNAAQGETVSVSIEYAASATFSNN